MEKIVPGGKKLPSGMPADQEQRLKQLEAEAEKMRLEIEAKQKSKRVAVNDWENHERNSAREGLRSDLAEMHLQKLTEEEAVAAAF